MTMVSAIVMQRETQPPYPNLDLVGTVVVVVAGRSGVWCGRLSWLVYIILTVPLPSSHSHFLHHLLNLLGHGLTQHRIMDQLIDYRLPVFAHELP